MTGSTDKRPPEAAGKRPVPRGYCPYLGLRSEPTSIFLEPTEDHRCHAAGRREQIALDHQATCCLTSTFESCPRFVTPSEEVLSPAGARPASVLAPDLQPLTDPEDAELEAPHRRVSWLRGLVGNNPGAALSITLAALIIIGGIYLFFSGTLFGGSSPAGAALVLSTPSPSPTASPSVAPAETPISPTPTPLPASPTRPPPTPPNLGPGQRIVVLTPPSESAGWVSSGDRVNHFGDRNLHAGVFEGQTYHGAIQFILAAIPPGSKIEQATVELVGLRGENVGSGGSWSLRLLSPEVDQGWLSATYDLIHNAAVADTIPPELSPQDLAEGQVNVFTFTPAQREELARRVERGAVSLRLDGPAEGENNLFTWDTGYGGGRTNRPVLQVIYQPPPTPTPFVITVTPTPADIIAAAAMAATATYEATVVGTPTPLPENVVTATPPVVITNTPTPENIATAERMAAEATARVFLYGTLTPLPAHVWTATPGPVEPEPAPSGDRSGGGRTGREPPTPRPTATPLPLLIPVDQITPEAKEPKPTATATPSALPVALNNKIVFLSDRFGKPAVFVMEPDGSNVALLTDRWPYEFASELDTFSPDRNYRLFVRGQPGAYEIAIQKVTTGENWSLAGGSRVIYDPVWSPDGVHVAFVSQETGNDEIFVINKDTHQETRLTNNQWEWDKHPSWSPDGSQIVFWSNRGSGRQQIWIMNADGSEPRNISNNEFNDWDPVWIKSTAEPIEAALPSAAALQFTSTSAASPPPAPTSAEARATDRVSLSPPLLLYPSDGLLVRDAPQRFTWQPTSTLGVAEHYRLEVWPHGSEPRGVVDTREVGWTGLLTLIPGIYHWRVRILGADTSGEIERAVSEVFTFRWQG